MKTLDVLLVIVVTLGGLVEAVPTWTELEKRIGNDGDFFPVLNTKTLAPQATLFQFYTSENWRNDANVKKDKSALAVLQTMHADGLFTAVILRGTQSSVVGPDAGTTTAEQFIRTDGNDQESALLTNGGFFITGTDKNLVSDFKNGKKGLPLPPDKYTGYSVGPTSVTKNTVDVPSIHADLYKRFTAEDKTFLTSGPDLKQPVDMTLPPYKNANTDAGRLQYFVHDDNGETIPTPPPDSSFVRSAFTHIPGGVVTANQRNERNVLVIVNDNIKVVCAYTSSREVGVTINEFRDLISQFLQVYLEGTKIEHTNLALNLDGGGSIYIGWKNNGKVEVLATGSLANPTQEPTNMKFREVTTMVKHSIPASTRGGTGGSTVRPT